MATVIDYKVQQVWMKYAVVNDKQYATKSYEVWMKMKSRCKINGSEQLKNPTYIGCTMSDNFQDFQFFAEWCQTQVGYGLPNYDLDKDILILGNKIYSECNCVFVPHHLNSFFNSNKAVRGAFPQGVDFHQPTSKYRASICIDKKQRHLGLFSTAKLASQIYVTAKEAEAKRWAARCEAGEFVVDPRVIERLKVWEVPCL